MKNNYMYFIFVVIFILFFNASLFSFENKEKVKFELRIIDGTEEDFRIIKFTKSENGIKIYPYPFFMAFDYHGNELGRNITSLIIYWKAKKVFFCIFSREQPYLNPRSWKVNKKKQIKIEYFFDNKPYGSATFDVENLKFIFTKSTNSKESKSN